MKKILIADTMSPHAQEILIKRNIKVDVKTKLSEAELCAIIGDYDGLAVRSSTKATEQVIETGRKGKLKIIGRAGIGVDNIDTNAATKSGVIVMNTPFGNSITTAEHAVSMMMALARQIPQANQSTHEGKWEKSRFMGVELYGKTLGLIGAGNIGGIVAARALGLKMKVMAFDPFLNDDRAQAMNIKRVSLEELLENADFISIHTPLNEGTHHLLNAERLRQCKKGAYLINCARGGIIDEKALIHALDDGHIAGAALDVFEEEPAKENALFGRDDVICTPHLGASTVEAQEKVAQQLAEQMADFLLDGVVTNALNMPSISAEDAPILKPYMALVAQMGSFVGQVTRSAISEVTIHYSGDASAINVKPLNQLIIAQILGAAMQNVNLVNAEFIAKERGLKVNITKSESSATYPTLVTITTITENGERAISGTLFGGALPRIVRIKGIAVELAVSEHMLYITNEDRPGLVGNLGLVLAENNVNIATFHLGRAEQGGEAVALLALDAAPTDAVIETIRKLDLVRQATHLHFPTMA